MKQQKPLCCIANLSTDDNPLDVKVHIWYNRSVNQYRWTLVDNLNPQHMESGNSHCLKDAMSDVAKTVEWLMETQDE